LGGGLWANQCYETKACLSSDHERKKGEDGVLLYKGLNEKTRAAHRGKGRQFAPRRVLRKKFRGMLTQVRILTRKRAKKEGGVPLKKKKETSRDNCRAHPERKRVGVAEEKKSAPQPEEKRGLVGKGGKHGGGRGGECPRRQETQAHVRAVNWGGEKEPSRSAPIPSGKISSPRQITISLNQSN